MALIARNMIIFFGMLLLFTMLNFDPAMSSVFFAILILGAIVIFSDKKVEIHLEKPGNNRLKSVAIAIGAYVAFMCISLLFLGLTKLGGPLSLSTSIKIYAEWIGSLMAQFSPALVDNPFLVLISWGLIIPVAETFTFFNSFFEWFCEVFKVNLSRPGFKVWLIMLLTSAIFTLFHITAKGLENNAGLLMTFIFGFVSMILVLFTGQVLEAIILHIITNSTSIIFSTGLLPTITSPWVLAIGIAIILYFAIRNIELRRFGL